MTETKALRSVKILILEPFSFVLLPILFCCPYYLQNYHSSVEIFALRGFKTVEGKEIKKFRSIFWNCSNDAPRTLYGASDLTLVQNLKSKWVFSLKFTIFC